MKGTCFLSARLLQGSGSFLHWLQSAQVSWPGLCGQESSWSAATSLPALIECHADDEQTLFHTFSLVGCQGRVKVRPADLALDLCHLQVHPMDISEVGTCQSHAIALSSICVGSSLRHGDRQTLINLDQVLSATLADKPHTCVHAHVQAVWQTAARHWLTNFVPLYALQKH